MEHIFDLLVMSSQSHGARKRAVVHGKQAGVIASLDVDERLRLRESKERGVFVEGLVEKKVTTAESAMEHVMTARKVAAVGATAMNERSSRSHLVITLSVRFGVVTFGWTCFFVC